MPSRDDPWTVMEWLELVKWLIVAALICLLLGVVFGA
jgi:uncharacterized membrane protein